MADNVIPFPLDHGLDRLTNDLVQHASGRMPGDPYASAGALFSAAYRTMVQHQGEERAAAVFRSFMADAVGLGLMTPAVLLPLSMAPADTFVLIYDPTDVTKRGWPSAPWIIGKRDSEDARWFDEDGYPLSPAGWVPLPKISG